MSKGRLEAFSDGVLAIIITIVILMFDILEGNDLNALKEMVPLFIVYLVSFVMIGMNWANHHHMLQVTEKVNGKIIWANHLYLFTMSFYPVATGWAGKSNFAALPTIMYVVINLVESLSYILLERTIISSHDCVKLKNAVNGSKKEALTIGLELAALVCAFFKPVRWAAYVLLVVMAAMWVIPDIRMSRVYDESRK